MRTQTSILDAVDSYFGLMAHALRGSASENASESRQPLTPEHSMSLMDRLDNWFWQQQVREREEWLAQSASVEELEARLRAYDAPSNEFYAACGN